jgi:hypothetical protein
VRLRLRAGRGARSPRGERVVVMVNSHQLLHFLRREEGGRRGPAPGGVPGVLAALDSGQSLESGRRRSGCRLRTASRLAGLRTCRV